MQKKKGRKQKIILFNSKPSLTPIYPSPFALFRSADIPPQTSKKKPSATMAYSLVPKILQTLRKREKLRLRGRESSRFQHSLALSPFISHPLLRKLSNYFFLLINNATHLFLKKKNPQCHIKSLTTHFTLANNISKYKKVWLQMNTNRGSCPFAIKSPSLEKLPNTSVNTIHLMGFSPKYQFVDNKHIESQYSP